jgi:hypothetical protein
MMPMPTAMTPPAAASPALSLSGIDASEDDKAGTG